MEYLLFCDTQEQCLYSFVPRQKTYFRHTVGVALLHSCVFTINLHLNTFTLTRFCPQQSRARTLKERVFVQNNHSSLLQCWSVLGPAGSCHWSSLDAGLSRLQSKSAVCGRCFLRFILVRSLSNTSPERSAETRSSNSPRSSSAALLALSSFSFFSWRWNKSHE